MLPRLPRTALAAALLATACGGPPADPAARTREVLGEIFARATFGDAATLAPRIVYRGDDPNRRWTDVCDAANPAERTYVQRLGSRITVFLGKQEPTFVSWTSEVEREGTWLVWTVRGAHGTARFACLEIDGVIALGDMDGP